MTTLPMHLDQVRANGRAASLQVLAAALMSLLAAWHGRLSERRALADLDDRMLRDIGITRAQASAETGKPIWQR